MGVIRYKIWSDLWANKGRTLQVVLIIAMGAFAIGMIVGTRTLVIGGMTELWRASSPAHIALWTNPRVGDDTITALEKNFDELESVEGYIETSIEWRLNPEDEWLAAGLKARDYKNQHNTTVDLLSGQWPREKTFTMGQGTDTKFGIQEGQQIFIRVDDREYTVEIGGTVYDPIIQPPSFGGPAQFYTTRDYIDTLTGERDYNRILAGAYVYDEPALMETVSHMQRKLERQGVESGGFMPPSGNRVSDPEEHFFASIMDAIFLLLA